MTPPNTWVSHQVLERNEGPFEEPPNEKWTTGLCVLSEFAIAPTGFASIAVVTNANGELTHRDACVP